MGATRVRLDRWQRMSNQSKPSSPSNLSKPSSPKRVLAASVLLAGAVVGLGGTAHAAPLDLPGAGLGRAVGLLAAQPDGGGDAQSAVIEGNGSEQRIG